MAFSWDCSVLTMEPWRHPELTGLGRARMRPGLRAWPSVEAALAADALDRQKLVDLNGAWDFRFFESPAEAGEALAGPDSDSGPWSTVEVPGNWTLQGFDRPHYTNVQMPWPETPPEPPWANPTGLYRRRFRITGNHRGRVVLHLGGAESVAVVWLDGALVGVAKDTRLESEFDVTALLGAQAHGAQAHGAGGATRAPGPTPAADPAPDPGATPAAGEHEIIVMVVRYSDASFIEDQDQWWMGGIHRDVYLYDEPVTRVEELRLVPELDADLQTGRLRAEVVLAGEGFVHGPDTPREPGVWAAQPSGQWELELLLFDGPGDLLNDGPEGSGAPAPNASGSPAAAAAAGPPATPAPLSTASGTCSGPPASDGHIHESAQRADRLRLVTDDHPVEPWSGERPYLYTALLVLRRAGSTEPLAVYRQRIGYRRVEIRDRQLLINGRPVLIHGVNRHEHDPERGKAITRASMIRDLELLRQYNFNAVRTAHYPNHPDWYDLCDQYGIYLWDEANIEAHHYYNDICRDPRYAGAFLDRVRRMVQRDHNHPSVIVWSLGNESGYGPNHDAAAGWLRHADPTRPLHYEGAVRTEFGQNTFHFWRGRTATDLICPMYATVEEITAWADRGGAVPDAEELERMAPDAGPAAAYDPGCGVPGTPDPRPLILCEYSHAMGNSNGGLADYYHAFRTRHGLQGGFIWDWVDQGILQHDEHGTPYWAYGGDFGDEPNDRDFCINGLIWPDRTPHPAMEEFRKLAQSLDIDLTVDRRAAPGVLSVRVTSRRDFEPTPVSSIVWDLSADGESVGSGRLPLPRLAPGEQADIQIDTGLPALGAADAADREYVLTVEVEAVTATALTPAGHRYAWEQWAPGAAVGTNRVAGRDEAPEQGIGAHAWRGPQAVRSTLAGAGDSRGAAAAERGAARLELDGAGTPALRVPGVSIRGPELALWRAPTENDLIRHMPDQEEKPGSRWIAWGLNRLQAHWTATEAGGLEAAYSVGDSPRARFSVALGAPDAAGWQALGCRVELDDIMTDLPRVGLRMELPAGYEQLEWYGRGPHESYPDRSAGYPVGRHRSTVSGQYVPYIVPQEHGGHADTRWVALANGSDAGQYPPLVLTAGAGEVMQVSALHLAPEDLDELAHTSQIVPRDTTILIADVFHRGIGTAACGPDCHPRWTRGGGALEWTWYLRFGSGGVDR